MSQAAAAIPTTTSDDGRAKTNSAERSGGKATRMPLSALPGEEGYHVTKDPRVRAVAWRDLTKVTKWQAFVEVTLSLPWIALALFGFYMVQRTGSWVWAVPGELACFYVFLTGLRQAHNAFHYAVGVSRFGCDLLMFFLSLVMTGSMHAVQINHLHHHKTNLSDEDVEGFTAKLSWWQALLVGPYFPLKLHWFAFKTGKRRQLKWIWAELLGNAVVCALVFGVALPMGQWWLGLFVGTMFLGQCGTGFFAVWTVHHDCDETHHIARTQRGRLKNAISYQMFHHVEHHLFPAVPTCHWPELGRRLDEVAPELRDKLVY